MSEYEKDSAEKPTLDNFGSKVVKEMGSMIVSERSLFEGIFFRIDENWSFGKGKN